MSEDKRCNCKVNKYKDWLTWLSGVIVLAILAFQLIYTIGVRDTTLKTIDDGLRKEMQTNNDRYAGIAHQLLTINQQLSTVKAIEGDVESIKKMLLRVLEGKLMYGKMQKPINDDIDEFDFWDIDNG